MVRCSICGAEMKSFRGGGDRVVCFKCGQTARSPDLKKSFWAAKREKPHPVDWNSCVGPDFNKKQQPKAIGNPPDPVKWGHSEWRRIERERRNLEEERSHLRQERRRLEEQLTTIKKQEEEKRCEEEKRQQQLDKLKAIQADQRTRVQIAVEEATPKKQKGKEI